MVLRKLSTFVSENLCASWQGARNLSVKNDSEYFLFLTSLNYYVIIKIEKGRNMKQILVGLIVLILLVGLVVGVTGAAIDFFANNFEMTGGAAAILLILLLLAVVLPTILDLLESYLK